MEAVSNVTNSASSVSSASALQATEDRFLKLLIAQMRNQDPLNPLENAEITSQMAQLSTVSGINKLTELVSGLSNSFAEAQTLQAASMLGRGVLTEGNTIALTNSIAYGAVDLPHAVDQLSITIRNAAGTALYTTELGPQSGGVVTFSWDGTDSNGMVAVDGSYTFDIQASVAGSSVLGTTLSYGLVNSVTLGTEGATLNINGIGNIGLSQIKQIM